MVKLKILPLGNIPEDVIEAVREELLTIRAIGSESLPMSLPAETYNPIRHQHLSEKVLEFLINKFEERVLGITDKDLYSGNLSYIFGQAQLKGNAAVVSIHRLNPDFYSIKAESNEEEDKRKIEERSKALLKERAVKEALHEVGHMLGLRHCDKPSCVMSFSNTITDVDRKGKELCGSCRNLLRI